MKTINLEPSPAGYRHMRRMFLETKATAGKKIVLAVRLMEEGFTIKAPGMRQAEVEDLLHDALELLVMDEQKRIQQMEEGLSMLPEEP